MSGGGRPEHAGHQQSCDGSHLYPESNRVPWEGFKQWADRTDLCFEKEPSYVTDWMGGWVEGGKYKFISI